MVRLVQMVRLTVHTNVKDSKMISPYYHIFPFDLDVDIRTFLYHCVQQIASYQEFLLRPEIDLHILSSLVFFLSSYDSLHNTQHCFHPW